MSEALTAKVVAILRTMHPHFGRWFYTRELSKLAGASTWVVSRKFSALVKEGIVKEKVEGREKYYALNISSSKTRALCQLFESERRERLYKKNRRLSWALEELTKRLLDFIPQVQCVILFGSAARGEMTKTSDVDTLAIVPNMSQKPLNQLMKDVDKMAREVAGVYPVNLAVITMTMHDYEAALREKRRIAEDALRDGIILFGVDRYLRLLSKVLR